ncbi:MAG: deoxyribose-phosphate aldolase [Clostridia bacterium]|nr:deoxyribose-phosphate aldolase [Clostridia bacterium]
MLFGKTKLVADGLQDLNSRTEFSVLDPRVSQKDLFSALNVAYKNRYSAVEIFPKFVKDAVMYVREKLDDTIAIIAVIDFPFGAGSLGAKLADIKRAISDGAGGVEVCVNIGSILSEQYADIKALINRAVRVSKGRSVRVMIEASYLNREQINKLCRVLLKTKADYVVANTGFGQGAITPEVVEQFKIGLKNKIKVKAAGGVSTKQIANNLIRIGADKIGTSRVL